MKLIISYSNLTPKIESCFEVGYEGVNKWSQLVQRVIAFRMYFVLSFRWRKRRRENKSRLMIELNVEVAKGQDVNTAILDRWEIYQPRYGNKNEEPL